MIELVLVICIISILASVAIPRFASSMVRHRADAAAQRIVADLNFAQRRARLASTSVSVIFDATNETYRLVGVSDPDHPGSEYTIRLFETPYEVGIVSADFNGDATVIFDGYGVPDSGGTVVVAAGTEQRTINLAAASGRVTLP